MVALPSQVALRPSAADRDAHPPRSAVIAPTWLARGPRRQMPSGFTGLGEVVWSTAFVSVYRSSASSDCSRP